jgi:hypothetical protein
MLQFKVLSPELEQKINDNNYDFNKAGLMLEKYFNIPEIEIEARIIRNDIDLVIFKRIQEFLQKNDTNIKLVEETKSLDIYVTMTKDRVNQSNKLSNLRFTLTGKDISEYCRTDKLPADFSLLYKSPLNWNKPITDINELDNYDIYTIDYNDTNLKHFINLHDIRFNGKIEIPFNKEKDAFEISNILQAPQFLKDNLTNANDKWKFYKTLNFNSLLKTYRLKHRFRYLYSFDKSMENAPDDFYIDITRVKMSKKEIVEQNGIITEIEIPVNNFIDSEIVEQNETYEIEFEIIKTDQTKLGNTIRNVIYPFISRKLLPYAFKSPIEYIYSQKEEELVKQVYLAELNKSYKTILEFKIKIINLLIDNADNINTLYRLKGSIDKNIENRINSKLIEIYKEYNYNFYERNLQLHNYSYYVKLIASLKKDNANTSADFKKKLNEYKKTYEDYIKNGLFNINNKNMFVSPQVITMEMNDIRENNLYSIQYNYTVTDKADGQGMLLFYFNSGDIWMNKLHLMDSNVRIFPTDLSLKQQGNFYLFNGEYITSLNRNKYGIFDTYFMDGISYINAPLMIQDEPETRIGKATDFVNKILETEDDKMIIMVKQFLSGDTEMSIWEAGNIIWNREYEYHLDGLIYTPALEPVGYEIDNKDSDLRLARTWNRNLKWKPESENTIDCLIRFEKDIKARYNGREVVIDKIELKHELSSGGQQEIKEYKVGNIFNGESNIIYNANYKKIYGALKPKPFQPIINNSLVPNKIYLPLEYDTQLDNGKGRWVIKSNDNQVVEDDTIVELIYSKENENERYGYNWKILRTRYDKTYLYRQGRQAQKQLFNLLKLCLNPDKLGYKLDENIVSKLLKYIRVPNDKFDTNIEKFRANKKYIIENYKSDADIPVDIKFGNMMRVANNIWNSIHNPITEQHILKGEDIPDEDIYYNSNEDNVRSFSVTKVLQKFHNYVKSEILLKNAIEYCKNKMGYVNILDMTCGQGGDIEKWNLYQANRCLAIDLYSENIKNAKDRYNNQFKQNNPKFINIDFIVGDTSKRFKTDTNNAIKDTYDRNVYNDLMKKVYNKQLFNVIPFMFSIHYFFKNRESFDNMIKNINDHLAVGGLLIGTCFDGNRILNEYVNNFMKTIETYTDESKLQLNDLVIYKDGRLILKIKPTFLQKNVKSSWFKKDIPELPNDESSIGLDIDVYIYTIEKMVKEYLVNYKYLEKELAKYEIVRLSNEEISMMTLPNKKAIGNFEDVYNFMREIKETVIDTRLINKINYILDNLSEDEFGISKLNSYFMFIKKGKVYVEEEEKKEVKKEVKKVVVNTLDELKNKYNEYVSLIEKTEKGTEIFKKLILKLNALRNDVTKNGNESMKKFSETVISNKLRELLGIKK